MALTTQKITPLHFIEDVLNTFSDGTDLLLRRFAHFLLVEFDINFKEGELYRERFNFFSLVDRFEDMGKFVRTAKSNCPVLVALWVIFLRVIFRNGELTMSMYKYKDQAAFLAEYEGMFPHVNDREMNFLYHIANWMHIMLGMVVAKKSKCLAMRVIPKLIEGHGTNYVLGTGQKKGTNRRAAIFERESGLVPSKKKKSAMNWSSNANKKQRCVGQSLGSVKASWGEQGSFQFSVGYQGANESYDLADFLLQTTDCRSEHINFEALHSMDTLSGISSFIAEDTALPAIEKWDLILKTTLLPSSLPARNACIGGLNAMIMLMETTPEAALLEVMKMDEEAAVLNKPSFLTHFESLLGDKTLSSHTGAASEEQISFAA